VAGTQGQDNKLAGLLTLLSLGMFRFFSVPQGYWRIVTAFGRFVRIAEPGLSKCVSILGFYQRPGSLIPSKEQVHDYEGEKVFTRDGVECIIDTVVFLRVVDVLKAIYEIESYEMAIKGLVQAILRNECGNMSARELLASRKQLTERLRAQLDTDTDPWGISVRLVEIKGIEIKTNTAISHAAGGGAP
jgi:regulator of protease activity HflC (stomatin/prohibitin superfamily)